MVTAQLMELNDPEIDRQAADFWQWTGGYLSFDFAAKGKRETRKLLVAEIPGVLIYPVAPSVSVLEGTNSSEPEPTWSVPKQQLQEIMEDAWGALEPEGKEISANVEQLLVVSNPDFLPYRDTQGGTIYI
jgi:hypothetical protein